MKIRLIVMLFISAFLAVAAPVMTVTNGQPDGNDHPYVWGSPSSSSRACRAS